MKRSLLRSAGALSLVALAACFVLRSRALAQASPGLTLAEARSALVDLDDLWMRATQGVPLAQTYLDRYLPRSASPGGFAVVAVSADDARELHRRQAFLSLYVSKHDALLKLVRSGRVPASVRLEEDQLVTSAQRERAAHVELYALAWIALGEGETGEQKCDAYARATAHARALGFGGPSAISDGDLPPNWRALSGRVAPLYAERETRFPAALCSEPPPASRADTRRALEAQLTGKLQQTITEHFDRTADNITLVQQSFTDLVNASGVYVPRDELLAMQKRVVDANSIYDLVGADRFGLGARIEELTSKTAELLRTLAPGQTAGDTFAGAQRELAALREKLASLSAIAKGFGGISFATRGDSDAVRPCTALPGSVEALSSATDLQRTFDACVGAALAVRERLFATPTAPPERDALLRHLQSLSTAFLNNNRF